MSSYLHIISGSMRILLDSARIHEILDVQDCDASTGVNDYCEWRGHALRRINLRTLLDPVVAECPPPKARIVYELNESGQPVLLEVDAVVKLESHVESSFVDFPPLPDYIGKCFDRLLLAPDLGLHLYRLKYPFEGDV